MVILSGIGNVLDGGGGVGMEVAGKFVEDNVEGGKRLLDDVWLEKIDEGDLAGMVVGRLVKIEDVSRLLDIGNKEDEEVDLLGSESFDTLSVLPWISLLDTGFTTALLNNEEVPKL